MHVIGATLTGGVAESGGSISAYNNGTINLEGCKITSARTTKYDGGCIYAEGTSTVHLVRCVVSGCRSPAGGGGIAASQSAKATIMHSTFQANEAYTRGISNGGAVAANGQATVSIQGSQFLNNMASWSGAAVSAGGNARVDILPSAKSGMQAEAHEGGGCEQLEWT
jgi:hypothetical protein